MLVQTTLVSQLGYKLSPLGRSFAHWPKFSKVQHVIRFHPGNLTWFWFWICLWEGLCASYEDFADSAGKDPAHVLIHHLSIAQGLL